MKILAICIAFLPILSYSQTCNCSQNFKWLQVTFEKNDAGFQYALDQKGTAAYQKHNAAIQKRVVASKNLQECAATLRDWLRFFRKAHFGIEVKQSATPPAAQPAKDIKWQTVSLSELDLRERLKTADKPGFEGIWYSAPYTIGIIKDSNQYLGYILSAPGSVWQKGQVKMRITRTSADEEVTYYMGDYSPVKIKSPSLAGNNYLQFGSFVFQRKFPEYPDDPEISEDFQLMSAKHAVIKQVSPNTLLLRVPSFDGGQKRGIDSLLKAYHDRIISTENLIIDMRNNGGGNDDSYEQIIPYLYTNPIRVVALEFLSTPLNNTRMANYLKLPDLSSKDSSEVVGALTTLNNNLGKFVNLGDSMVYLTKLDTVYKFPRNVAVVMNENNGSTAEQFLLAAKQSKKVKLFGTTTMGVLDISNMHFVDFPCGDMTLGYCLSKSLRIPDMAIDGKGIQPDYYIDNQIKSYGWIPYVRRVLDQDTK
jgi:hypothetical protein